MPDVLCVWTAIAQRMETVLDHGAFKKNAEAVCGPESTARKPWSAPVLTVSPIAGATTSSENDGDDDIYGVGAAS